MTADTGFVTSQLAFDTLSVTKMTRVARKLSMLGDTVRKGLEGLIGDAFRDRIGRLCRG